MSLYGNQRKITVDRLKDGSGTTDFARRDGTWAVPPGTSSGTFPIVKVMTADQSINSSTTLTNVTDLVFAIGAGETWAYVVKLYTAAEGMAFTGLKIGATVPAGATIIGVGHSSDPYQAGDPIGSDRILSSGSAMNFPTSLYINLDDGWFDGWFSVANGATPGNFQLQFAQSTSDATNLTLNKGSFGIGHKAT